MPYKSKAERAAERWMTLPQVLAHIQLVEKLEEPEARHELLKALTDGAFRSQRSQVYIRWRDEFSPSGGPPGEIAPHDVPPRGEEWAKADIRWDTGEVLDPYGALEDREWQPAYRVVWIARSKVAEIWPPRLSTEAARAAQGRTNPEPLSKRNTGPKTGKTQAMIAAMRKDIQDEPHNLETLFQMSDKELQERYAQPVGAKRSACRKAREQVLSEDNPAAQSSPGSAHVKPEHGN